MQLRNGLVSRIKALEAELERKEAEAAKAEDALSVETIPRRNLLTRNGRYDIAGNGRRTLNAKQDVWQRALLLTFPLVR